MVSVAIMVLGSVSLFGQYGMGYGRGGYGRGYGMNGGCGYGRGYGMHGARYGRGYRMGGCGYGMGYGRGYGYYNAALTQEQITQIQAIEDKYFPQMDDLRREIYNKNQAINLEMSKENPDQNAINSAIDARTKSFADLDKLRAEFLLEMDKVYKTK